MSNIRILTIIKNRMILWVVVEFLWNKSLVGKKSDKTWPIQSNPIKIDQGIKCTYKR